MATMRPAPSCRAALAQATIRWPNRSKASDGICGDPAHQARVSDHNPGKAGYCHAWDLTHDVAHGVDAHAIADKLRIACKQGKEQRVKYIISNGRIASPVAGWIWRSYTGRNPHTKHCHVSVKDTSAACLDQSPWPGIVEEVTPMERYSWVDCTVRSPDGKTALLAACKRLGLKLVVRAGAPGFAICSVHVGDKKLGDLNAALKAAGATDVHVMPGRSDNTVRRLNYKTAVYL